MEDHEPSALKRDRRKSVLAIRVYCAVLVAEVLLLWLLYAAVDLPGWIAAAILSLQSLFIIGDIVNILAIDAKLRRRTERLDNEHE